MPPVIDRNKCIKCGTCEESCCMDVFKKTETEPHEILVRYPDECWHCRACVLDCPQDAITMRYPLSHMMFVMDVPAAEGGEQ